MSAKYIIIIFAFSFASVAGQSLLKGKITDSITKIALPGASITITAASGSAVATLTGSKDGLFKLSLPSGNYQLMISYAGYRNKTYPFVMTNAVMELPPISLCPDFKKLTVAKVVATKPFITMGPGKLTMNVAESGLSAGNDAWIMLQQAPGVQTGDDGSLSLNGKTVSVYIDGRRQYLSGEQLKIMLSALQAKQVDKLELMSNPSARYDAAGAAVINIKTIRLNKPGYNGTFTSGVGSSRYLKYNTGIDMNYRSGKVNLFGGYDYSHNANLYKPVYERVTGTNTPIYIAENEYDYRSRNNHSYKAGLDWNISKLSTFGLLVKGFVNHRGRSVTGDTKMGSIKGQADSLITTNTTGDATFSSPSVNLYYKTSLDTSGEKVLVFNADYYRYEQQWADDFFTRFTSNGASYQPSQYRRDQSPTILNIYSASADYEQPFWNGKLETGVKTSVVRTDNDVRWDVGDGSAWVKDALRTNYFKYSEDIYAGYAGYSKTFGKWETEAALRTEITKVKGHSITIDSLFTRSYQNWFPNLGVTFNPNKTNQWSLSYRKSIDRPVYSFVNPFIIFRGQFNYFRGNTNLKPMYSNSWELGYAWKSMLFINFSYTITSNTMASFYEQDNNTKIITEYYDNFASRDWYHLTVSFNKAVKKWWSTSNYISTGLMKYRYEGLPPGGSPTVYCYISSVQSLNLLKWKSRLDISGLLNLPYSTGYYRYKGYGSVNLGYTREVLKKKGSLRLNVTDLFKTNVTQKRTLYGGLESAAETSYDSRTVNLAFTYRFGKAQIRRSNRRSSIESETGRIQ
ncbi:MAG: outer membrane beta-barrel family protein [Chitinophagaceae bacterium]